MSALALKIPPLLLTFLFASAMWLTSIYTPQFIIELPYQKFLAFCLLVVAIFIVYLGVLSFKRAKTTVNPLNPEQASSLVISGIYRFTRNPMYLGFLLILLAVAIWLSNIVIVVFIPAFILYMNKFQIVHEENRLLSLFGESYRQYLKTVRRWI